MEQFDGGIGYFLSVSILQAFVDVWTYLVLVLVYGGWLALVFVLFRMYLILHREEARKKNGKKVEWVYLNLAIPDLPTQSILAAELLFAQLHTTRKKFKWQQNWIQGKLGTTFSFEIVSLGGLIRYIIRTSREHADTVRSAVFAQYPDAEITEVGDYMDAFSMPFNPDHVDYDIYGTELSLSKAEAYPIKTYPSFEHRAAETIVDPLAGMLEVMSNIDPDEVMAVQIIAGPSGDEWKDHAEHVAKELKHKDEPHGEEGKEPPPSMMQHMSDQEKNVINMIHAKLGKLSYIGKIRFLYAAPKERFKKDMRVPAGLGSFAPFSTTDLNGFKENGFTKTKVQFRVAEQWEQRRISRTVLWRKRVFMINYIGRSLGFGGTPYHLSTEELASLFHFPLENVRKAPISKIEAKKGEPPVNLPI